MGADTPEERADDRDRERTLDEGKKGTGCAAHPCHDEENAYPRRAVARIAGVNGILAHDVSCKRLVQEIGTENRPPQRAGDGVHISRR